VAEGLTLAKDNRASELRKYAESSQFLFTLLLKLGLSGDRNWDIPALEMKRTGRNVAAVLTISLISSTFAGYFVMSGPATAVRGSFRSIEIFQQSVSQALGSSVIGWVLLYLATFVAQVTVFAIFFGRRKRSRVHLLPRQSVLVILFISFFGGLALSYAPNFGAPVQAVVFVTISCMAFSTWSFAKLKAKYRGDGTAKEVD
jgi:hypothetical protein